MAKDAYWFKHDANAGQDIKLRKLCHLHTHWGKGIYWDVIEQLRQEQEYKYQCDDSSLQMLCEIIGCKDFSRFKTWFFDCKKLELFKGDKTFFWSDSLIVRMREWEKQKRNGSQPKSQTEAKPKPKGKPNGSIRGEENREDISVISISSDFEKFWDLYDKKRGDKEKIEKKWRKLTDSDREAIMSYIPKYKQSQPDKKYRKDPETFLNNKSWNDELIESESVGEILPKPILHPIEDMNEFFGTKTKHD